MINIGICVIYLLKVYSKDKYIFPLSNPSNNIWNILYDDDYEEYLFETNVTDINDLNYPEGMSSLIFHYWKKRE